ncbi:tetratricopeptide repeat protein 27-like protein [Cucumis melo var. makuwa]|uniref:Tetratricopeptide repeat protein 27-like protein n=1 Tax=Cucumis melo var. makuwa TaxID=1194695 RepID=A0A5A7ST37_CUCMM|nr:tetratricopeptide repeat protein 27-like protein [Cucumis melo var. makuwa]
MSESAPDFLRTHELRLLYCTFSSLPSDCPAASQTQTSPNGLHECLDIFVNSIVAGDYQKALASNAARLVLGLVNPCQFTDSTECAEQVYAELLECAEKFVISKFENEEDRLCRLMIVVCIAIASFLSFTQSNVSGPLEGLARSPMAVIESKVEGFVEWDNWARHQLMFTGSDLFGKFTNIQYIVFAKMLLTRIKDMLSKENASSICGMKSISWWLARVLLFQQRILDERSSSLFDHLQVLMGEALVDFGTQENVKSYWGANLQEGEAPMIVSMIHLEAGIMEYHYGRVDSCRQHFESAEAESGLELSITGVLGFRTSYQVEPKAQLVLVANIDSSEREPGNRAHGSTMHKDNLPSQSKTFETSDILMAPKLLNTDDESGTKADGIHNGGSTIPNLRPIQQAIILAKCLLIEKSSRSDEMQRWDMAPYIEAIDTQQSSLFMVRFFCNILRVRWESSRSRTKERALVMMEKLVEGYYDCYPGVVQRMYFCCGVYVPTFPALRKEYGELLVSCGLIGEAVKIFEELELWDNLIFCYRLLEKKAAAVDLIKSRLSQMPNDPKLWCSLGDVTNNDACYEKALEVSNNRSARAKRSLARSAYSRGDYETSKTLWESAMALNSMYPDGWFALGAAALKARDIDKALDGFTRAVQLDPENGEAWNNIACLHMIKKRNKEAFIAFKEALKFKRNSWQLWENYSHVALDTGNIGQALEAVQQVADMTNNKRVDAELLERIMQEVERRASNSHSESNYHEADLAVEKSRETDHMVELIGKVLRQIVRVGTGADIWGIYARWHKIKGDFTMCSEALLKQVRSYQGSDLWKDREKFIKFAQASLELSRVYMHISSTANSQRELYAAEMHLKNTGVNFSDTKEYRDLEACLDEAKDYTTWMALCMVLASDSIPVPLNLFELVD